MASSVKEKKNEKLLRNKTFNARVLITFCLLPLSTHQPKILHTRRIFPIRAREQKKRNGRNGERETKRAREVVVRKVWKGGNRNKEDSIRIFFLTPKMFSLLPQAYEPTLGKNFHIPHVFQVQFSSKCVVDFRRQSDPQSVSLQVAETLRSYSLRKLPFPLSFDAISFSILATC